MKYNAQLCVLLLLVVIHTDCFALVIRNPVLKSMGHSFLQVAPAISMSSKNDENWHDKHLAHGAKEIHEETDEEMLESETAAAIDAHDSIDAGMEAAAEERAVMLAAEMAKKFKEKCQNQQKSGSG
jgi:hypothetical protein